MPCVGLQFVIVILTDHTRLLFGLLASDKKLLAFKTVSVVLLQTRECPDKTEKLLTEA